MSRAIFLLATLILSPHHGVISDGQQRRPAVTILQEEANPARPVKSRPVSLAETEKAARQFDFLGFEFKEIYYGIEGPNYTNIAGEPAKGAQLIAEARMYMEGAIATIKFELLDQRGRPIQNLHFVKKDTDLTSGEFTGVMIVPAQPFRVAVSGLDVTGKPYRRVYKHLFRPTNAVPSANPRVPLRLPPERLKLYRQALVEHDRQAKRRLAEEGRSNPGGVITLPRVEVSEVTYEPFMSEQGNPIGIRVRYAVRVSQDGYYQLHPSVLPLYTTENLRGQIRMEAIAGNVAPPPLEAGTNRPSDLLRFGGSAKFMAGQVYRFIAEMIPDFALRNASGTRFCITMSRFKESRASEAAWRAMLSSDTPVTYRVDIGRANFTGQVENFYAPSVFYRSFLKEGAKECSEDGNINF
jgi:hypothetical protein